MCESSIMHASFTIISYMQSYVRTCLRVDTYLTGYVVFRDFVITSGRCSPSSFWPCSLQPCSSLPLQSKIRWEMTWTIMTLTHCCSRPRVLSTRTCVCVWHLGRHRCLLPAHTYTYRRIYIYVYIYVYIIYVYIYVHIYVLQHVNNVVDATCCLQVDPFEDAWNA